MSTRKSLLVGKHMGNRNVSEWTDEQRRLACGWANHELRAQTDSLCAPYDWTPEWTNLIAWEIHEQLGEFYAQQEP